MINCILTTGLNKISLTFLYFNLFHIKLILFLDKSFMVLGNYNNPEQNMSSVRKGAGKNNN